MKNFLLRHHLSLFFLTVIFFSGCATPPKRIMEAQQSAYEGRVSFKAPVDWVRYEPNDQVVLLTRDGVPIQHVSINLGKPETILPVTKPKLDHGRLPQEIGEMVLAEKRAAFGNIPLNTRELIPAVVGGTNGFRARASFRNDRGAPYEMMIAGAQIGDTLVVITYQALAVHFFERDQSQFEQLMSTLAVR